MKHKLVSNFFFFSFSWSHHLRSASQRTKKTTKSLPNCTNTKHRNACQSAQPAQADQTSNSDKRKAASNLHCRSKQSLYSQSPVPTNKTSPAAKPYRQDPYLYPKKVCNGGLSRRLAKAKHSPPDNKTGAVTSAAVAHKASTAEASQPSPVKPLPPEPFAWVFPNRINPSGWPVEVPKT